MDLGKNLGDTFFKRSLDVPHIMSLHKYGGLFLITWRASQYSFKHNIRLWQHLNNNSINLIYLIRIQKLRCHLAHLKIDSVVAWNPKTFSLLNEIIFALFFKLFEGKPNKDNNVYYIPWNFSRY